MSKKNILQIAAAPLVLIRSLVNDWKDRPKLIALTFDDGPSPYTGILLDGLEICDVAVTFFMNGENGTGGTCGIKNGHKALLARMWENGHQLANHTYRHTSFHGLRGDQIASEVFGVEELIFDAVGGTYKCLVRTPYGYVDKTVTDNVHAPIVLWSVDTLDWKYRYADYVYNKILSCVKDRAIILMHDIHKSSVEGVLRAINTLKTRGYEFVTVSELMRRTGVHLTDGAVYSHARSGFRLHPAYKAPEVRSVKDTSSGLFEITCFSSEGLSVYYTTDGSYPNLSDHLYSKAVLVKPGTAFTAIGVDQWGTRTPVITVTVGEKNGQSAQDPCWQA